MQKILKFTVETGPTPVCENCPFAVRVWDDYHGEYKTTCNKAPYLFNCGEVNLTTLRPIQDDETSEK